MHSIWSGTLSFALINIPVQVFSAHEEHALSFDLLHKSDLSPIRYARFCKAEEKEVPYKDIVKGYEYEKGEYVVVDEEDFKKVNVEKTSTIEIVQFANASEIDPIYFEKPYFLAPGKGADKSYVLLRETLEKSKKVGVVKFVFKNREHVGIIKPYGEAIVLTQMRFAHEIRSVDELKLPTDVQVNKKELDMALKLVEQLSEPFKPQAFKDEYTEELKEIIEEKIKGEAHHKPKKGAMVKPSKVHDIMSLLKASLEEKPRKRKRA